MMASTLIIPGHRAGLPRGLVPLGASALLLALAACTTPPRPPVVSAPPTTAPTAPPVIAPAPVAQPAPVIVIPPPAPQPPVALVPPPPAAEVLPPPQRIAAAATPMAYRRDGALHLYQLHSDRIYQGKLPPLLYAVGVLNVSIDGRGAVRRLEWMREPKHAPEVVAEIERIVRAAAPFPAPVQMGAVVYTDIWLWDKSGRFQLDTLTEGQLSALPATKAPDSSPVKPVAERRRVPAKKATKP
jgi:periplasmic protein TonB